MPRVAPTKNGCVCPAYIAFNEIPHLGLIRPEGPTFLETDGI